MKKTEKLKLAEAEEIAKKLTHDALMEYEIPPEICDRLALGVLFEGDYRVFMLYVPGERPKDGKIVSRVRVSLVDGTAEVEVLGLERKQAGGRQ
jgi:hypothetical protein